MRFNVGDSVVVIGDQLASEYVGKRCVILFVDQEDANLPYYVKHDDPADGRLRRWYRDTDLSPPPTPAPSQSIVDEALAIVRGNREQCYGRPTKNFETIAAFWTAYLAARPDPAAPIAPVEVSHLMGLVKLARLANRPDHRDSLVDLVGYADCADMILNAK